MILIAGAPLVGCTTDAQCLHGGKCDVPGSGFCRCVSAAFLGPLCAVRISVILLSFCSFRNSRLFGSQVTTTNKALLDPMLTFAYQLDPMDPTLMHFRMDSTTGDRWISVMLSLGDYHKGDSMTAYKNAAGINSHFQSFFGFFWSLCC